MVRESGLHGEETGLPYPNYEIKITPNLINKRWSDAIEKEDEKYYKEVAHYRKQSKGKEEKFMSW